MVYGAIRFRNGQLKQLNDGEEWEKQKHFIKAISRLKKIHAYQNENRKKSRNLFPIADEH